MRSYIHEVIFNQFLGFLSAGGLDCLLGSWKSIDPHASNEARALLEEPANRLSKRVREDIEEEDAVRYLNVYLWRQRQGQISLSQQIDFELGQANLAWLIHRHMSVAGYPGVEDRAILSGPGMTDRTTYALEIERLRGFFLERECYLDDDYFSYFAALLTVLGPRLRGLWLPTGPTGGPHLKGSAALRPCMGYLLRSRFRSQYDLARLRR